VRRIDAAGLGLSVTLLAACGGATSSGSADAGGAADASSDADTTTSVDATSDAVDNDIPEIVDASSDVRSEEPVFVDCTGLTMMTGFSVGWERLNHRISTIVVEPEYPADDCVADAWRAVFVGGDFTTGEVATDGAIFRVEAADIDLAAYGLRAARVAIPIRVRGPGGRASGRVTLPESLASEAGFVYAFVTGITLDTNVLPQPDGYPAAYEPRLGYTSRGFGASAFVDTRATGGPRLEWTARFEHGVSWDDFLRADMNDAILVAESAMLLHVVVLAAPLDTGLAIQTQEVAWVQETAEPYRMTSELEPDVEPGLRRALRLDPSAEGLIAFSAFDFRLYPDVACAVDGDCDPVDACGADGSCELRNGPPGDYVRAFRLGVEQAPGEVLVTGYASTASEAFAFRPLRNEFSATVARLYGVGAETYALEGSGPAGQVMLERVP
jgi:hypothetical protein